jgi:ABC-type Zn uptake system ZnuABC Zn-binding protein ZnuA
MSLQGLRARPRSVSGLPGRCRAGPSLPTAFPAAVEDHSLSEATQGPLLSRTKGAAWSGTAARTVRLLLLVLLSAAACTRYSSDARAQQLDVVATTTIVGDVVSQIGGEHIRVSVLLPVGADPHAFEATPQDAARLSQADLVFANGAGLEAFLEPLLGNVSTGIKVVDVSAGIPLLSSAAIDDDHATDSATGDPHTWTDPNNVITWTLAIEGALVAADPDHAADYRASAAAYRGKLQALDAWVREQIAQIPPERRQLVTDHATFGYFAQRYGLEPLAAVVPGYSTVAQPSARDLAALEDAIAASGARAIFVGTTVSDSLARRVAEDMGVPLVPLYTGSLSGPQGPASTYLDYTRYNVAAVVQALK